MAMAPEQFAAYNTKAAMYREEGRSRDARDILHHGLRSARDQLGEDHEVCMSMMHNYGALLIEMGLDDEAAPLLEEALAARRENLGETHPDTCQTMHNYATLLQKKGKLAEELALRKELVAARTKLEKGLEGAEKEAAEKQTLFVKAHYCDALVKADKLEEATPMVTEAMEAFVARYGKNCKSYVPQEWMTVSSTLYSAIIKRPQMGADMKMGGRLVAALTAIVSDKVPASNPAEAGEKAQVVSTIKPTEADVKRFMEEPGFLDALKLDGLDDDAKSKVIARAMAEALAKEKGVTLQPAPPIDITDDRAFKGEKKAWEGVATTSKPAAAVDDGMSSELAGILEKLNLSHFRATLVEEDVLDLPLLKSMGPMFDENMTELGFAVADVAKLKAVVKPEA